MSAESVESVDSVGSVESVVSGRVSSQPGQVHPTPNQVALNTQKDYAAFELPEADRALLQHYTQAYGGGLSGPPILGRSTAQVAAAPQP